MTPDMEGFLRYVLVGISNTVIHWTVFFALCLGWHAPQSLGNVAGFVAAASFSFTPMLFIPSAHDCHGRAICFSCRSWGR